MVCKDCEKKLGTVICPDTWKDGAKNAEAGQTGRKVGQNMLLKKGVPKPAAKAATYTSKCGICKVALHQPGAYCNNCAYKKGICSMCGKAIINTKFYKQSTT